MLQAVSDGRILAGVNTSRALDLLALPFPDEGIEAIVASFDGSDHLADLTLSYRAGLGEYYPEPVNLGHLFEEYSPAAPDEPAEPGLRRRAYHMAEWLGDVSIVTHGAGVGALVRLTPKGRKGTVPLSRDFGGVHLDRSFEQNRLGLTPE